MQCCIISLVTGCERRHEQRRCLHLMARKLPLSGKNPSKWIRLYALPIHNLHSCSSEWWVFFYLNFGMLNCNLHIILKILNGYVSNTACHHKTGQISRIFCILWKIQENIIQVYIAGNIKARVHNFIFTECQSKLLAFLHFRSCNIRTLCL